MYVSSFCDAYSALIMLIQLPQCMVIRAVVRKGAEGALALKNLYAHKREQSTSTYYHHPPFEILTTALLILWLV